MESGIDGKEASRLVKDYFVELYSHIGVFLFEIENVLYNSDEKSWIIECSFHRTMAHSIKSFYEVVVYTDGKIGQVTKKAE